MVDITGVASCCVGAILHDFGGSQNRGSMSTGASRQQITLDIANKVANFNQYGRDLSAQAVVTAFTTTEQTQANSILEEIGFSKSDPYTKSKHPESDLLVWQMHAPKVLEWAQNYRRNNQPAPVRQVQPVARPAAEMIQWDEDFEEEDM